MTPEENDTKGEDTNRRRDEAKPSVLHVVGTTLLPIILTIALFYSIMMFLPSPEDPCAGYIADLPTATFGQRVVIDLTSATVDFGKVSCDPSPVKIEILLVLNYQKQGRYVFQNNDDGAMALAGGENIGTVTYEDQADNQRINPGDRLVLTNLTPLSMYTIKMMFADTGDLMTSTTLWTYDRPMSCANAPVGSWSGVEVTNSTAANVTFNEFEPPTYPSEVKIVLVRNGWQDGTYFYDKGIEMVLGEGIDVGDVSVFKVCDGFYYCGGDGISLTNLSPSSDYRVTMVWAPCMEVLDYVEFSTP
jgi:hypothetical protein